METIANTAQLNELVDGLAGSVAAEISASKASDPQAEWSLVGIRSRGDILAGRLAERLTDRLSGNAIGGRVGAIDITLYRDDLSEIGAQAVVRTTEIPFDIDGANIVLVDDVLMTGRSIRAALQVLMDFGRPRRVWLAVLVDRGGRELPICPDIVGLDLSGSGDSTPRGDELVDVQLTPLDDRDAIVVRPRPSTKRSSADAGVQQ